MCIDVTISDEHCGSCNSPCSAGETCVSGSCESILGTGGSGSGGAQSSGGTSLTGGAGTGGGQPTGGSRPTGGAGPTGGATPTGGAWPTGGAGGSEGGTGGAATGGAATGGAATGGAATGGGPTGGTSNGCDATGFYVEGTEIHDVNCNPFVLRGVNDPYAWFVQGAQGRYADIASVGANAVRVVMATGARWTRTSGTEVASIISWTRANRLVAILEVHDSTGYPEQAESVHPDDAVSYWLSSDIRSAIDGNEAYVMINIANEPFGNNATSSWQSFHSGAVASLRSAGLRHTLIVDAPNWGQDWENTMRDGSAATSIFDADPDRNVVFSIHMYDVYDSSGTVSSYFSNFLSHGIPLIVGEFAADHGSSGNVDEDTIMSEAQSRGVGYLGWSWSGNSGDLSTLDITSSFDVNSLTTWGNRLINGTNGIAQTAQTCTCFQ